MASMEADDDVQYSRRFQAVSEWLKSIYGPEHPPFEINPYTINALYEMSQRNQRANQDDDDVLADLDTRIEEYRSEGSRLASILEGVGLHPGSLSRLLISSLRSLAALAVALRLREPDTSSYLVGLQNLTEETMDLEKERREETKMSENLRAKITEALQSVRELNRLATQFQEQAANQTSEVATHLRNVSYMDSKGKEYGATLNQLKTSLASSGVSADIYHSALVVVYEELQALQRRTEPKLAALQAYHDLPPDLSLAKVRLEDARKELSDVHAELANTIGQFQI
eukprot:TRINITY_DN2175_c0_g2_i1.p1 TRINITY_DN2175_c0_g2~~TRINITY_DN2175_c0_g2_i1.p1  ORF type:complete len:285 (+),score=53.30 TRINITY_DN2175_c0_g2_i1:235-1089(+)